MTSELEIVSVHIPKTAGKAFNDVLLQVYGRDKLILDYANNPHDPQTSLKTDIRAIHGHFPIDKYEKYFPNTKKIIWLRHPVMRIVSSYFYLKNRLEIVAVRHPKRHAVLSNSESTIIDFAQFQQSEVGGNSFYQQRYTDFNPEKLRDFYFVGIQEYFECDLTDLKAMMGWTEAIAKPVNQNKYPDYKAKMLDILSDDRTIEQLESILHQEMELYQLALDLRVKRRGETSLSAKILLEQKQSEIKLGQFPKTPKRNRMPSAKDRRETVIAVLGMHRSGTSCLAGSLQAAGLFSGKVEDWSVANSKGNRENREIMTLNDSVLKSTDGSWDHPPVEIEWSQSHREQRNAIAANYFSHSLVWMFKDPRTLLTLQFWQEGIKNLEFIGTFRHPMKVAMSLYQRDPMSITLREGIKLWCHYNSLLLREWQKSPFPLLCFDLPGKQYFDQLEQVIAKLSKYAHLSVAEAKKFYECKLVHQENIIAATELFCDDGQENQDTQLLARALKLYQDLKLASGIKLDEELPGKSTYLVPLSATIAACEAGIKLQPNNPHLYFILGNIQYKQQDFPAAIVSYEQTLRIDSEYFAVFQNLGDSLTRLDRLDEAIDVYQKILKLQPDNFKICCLLGKLYQKQGKSEAAVSHCQRAIAINPTYVASYNSLANIQRQRGELKAAIISYRQSLELNPQQYGICLALANSLVRIGQGEEAAIFFFAKAQQLDREHPAAVNGLGSVARQQGNYGAAVEYFCHSLKLDSQQYNIQIALGHSLFQLERFTEAAQAFQHAISLGDKQPALYTVLGNAQLKSGNTVGAISSYKKAIEIDPKQPFGVYKKLADCFSKLGKTEKAIIAYTEALKIKPDDNSVRRSLDNIKLLQNSHK